MDLFEVNNNDQKDEINRKILALKNSLGDIKGGLNNYIINEIPSLINNVMKNYSSIRNINHKTYSRTPINVIVNDIVSVKSNNLNSLQQQKHDNSALDIRLQKSQFNSESDSFDLSDQNVNYRQIIKDSVLSQKINEQKKNQTEYCNIQKTELDVINNEMLQEMKNKPIQNTNFYLK
jgi:hypothetical protein